MVSMGTANVEQNRNALKEMSGVAKQAVKWVVFGLSQMSYVEMATI